VRFRGSGLLRFDLEDIGFYLGQRFLNVELSASPDSNPAPLRGRIVSQNP
jgi:hypothetical protein